MIKRLVRKTRCCRQGPHAPKTLSKCSCMTSREVSQARTKRNENEAPDRGEGYLSNISKVTAFLHHQFPKATVCYTLMTRGSAFRNIG